MTVRKLNWSQSECEWGKLKMSYLFQNSAEKVNKNINI